MPVLARPAFAICKRSEAVFTPADYVGGGLATLHANSAAEGLSRLEDLIGEVTQRLLDRKIAEAINAVIYIERTALGPSDWGNQPGVRVGHRPLCAEATGGLNPQVKRAKPAGKSMAAVSAP